MYAQRTRAFSPAHSIVLDVQSQNKSLLFLLVCFEFLGLVFNNDNVNAKRTKKTKCISSFFGLDQKNQPRGLNYKCEAP